MFNPTRELILNPTFWGCLAAFLILIWQFARLRGDPAGVVPAGAAIRKFLTGPAPLAVFIFAAIARAGFAVYMAYVAPLDIMQDFASARQLLQGDSAYPSDMKAIIWDSLERNPPALSLGRWIPSLRQKEVWETHSFLSIQAHPPLLLILAVPIAALLGPHATALFVDLLSLAGLGLVLLLILKSGAFHLTPRSAALVFAFLIAWEPTISLLRQGQSGLLISPLIVLAWFLLRRGHPWLAGIPIGVATCLKLYPGLLLVYLLFYHRRALATALVTILIAFVTPVPFVGWRIYSEYYSAAGAIAKIYGSHPINLSLLALFTKNGLPMSGVLVALLGLASVAATILYLRSRPDPVFGEGFDLEYSLFVIFMVLLSPIAWDHYLVILILPIVVLGRQVLSNRPCWTNLFGFGLLMLFLSIPVLTFVFPFSDKVSPEAVNIRTVSIPSLLLIALALWIARLRVTANARSALDKPSYRRTSAGF